MAWMQIDWQLTISSDGYAGQPGLRFVQVNVLDGRTWARTYPAILVAPQECGTAPGTRQRWSGHVQSVQPIPTDENPYFALAAQVYEQHPSVESRLADDVALAESIESVCQEVVDAGLLPQARVLEAAAAAPRLASVGARAQDRDTWVGAAGWVDRDYGRRVAPALAHESSFATREKLSPSGAASHRSASFSSDGHNYELVCKHKVYAGRLDEHSQFSLQGWLNASWVR